MKPLEQKQIQIQKQNQQDFFHQGTARSMMVVAGLVLLAVSSRIFPHPFQFTMLGAVSLFAAVFFSERRWALLVPVLSLFVSDFFLGFYSGMIWNYGAMIVAASVGFWVAHSSNPSSGASVWFRRFSAAISGSLIFFFLSNLVVFLDGSMYPLTLRGFWQCYVMALPFLGRQWMSDMLGFSALCALWSLAPVLKSVSLFTEVTEKNS